MLKVKISVTSSVIFAENAINTFIVQHPKVEIVDIKMCGDGHSSCITYMIMYKE